MADLSTYISVIEKASRGEAVRDSIINALNAINSQGVSNAISLDGHPASDFVLVADMYNGKHFDSTPTQGSKKAVTSGGLYSVLGDIASALDTINGESPGGSSGGGSSSGSGSGTDSGEVSSDPNDPVEVVDP